MSLRGILDEYDARSFSETAQGVNVGHLAVKVDHDHRRSPRGDDRFELRGRQQESIRAYIREHWRRPGEDNGLGRRDERVGGQDDLVADADPQGHESQPQGIGPIAHADRVRYTAVGSPRLLEVRDRRTIHEPARAQRGPRVLDSGADVARHRRQVGEGDTLGQHNAPPSWAN